MRNKRVANMCMNGLFAAIFVAMTMINPLSWSFIQFRISDMLSVAPYCKKQFTSGFLIGGVIANIFSPLGLIDVIFGTASEAIPIIIFAYSPLKESPMWVKNVCRALIIGIIIGTELTMMYGTPFILGFASLIISEVVVFGLGAVLLKPVFGYLSKFVG